MGSDSGAFRDLFVLPYLRERRINFGQFKKRCDVDVIGRRMGTRVRKLTID